MSQTTKLPFSTGDYADPTDRGEHVAGRGIKIGLLMVTPFWIALALSLWWLL